MESVCSNADASCSRSCEDARPQDFLKEAGLSGKQLWKAWYCHRAFLKSGPARCRNFGQLAVNEYLLYRGQVCRCTASEFLIVSTTFNGTDRCEMVRDYLQNDVGLDSQQLARRC